MALLLQKRGITRIRPLAGGIDLWLEHKFPLESAARIQAAAAPAAPEIVINVVDQKTVEGASSR